MSATENMLAVCECGCTLANHVEADYDFDGERYVADPRPCLTCNDCRNFFEE